MPQIVKLVPVDGKLGVVLDIPPSPKEGYSVSIYTADELAHVLRLERKACAKICRNLADTWARKDDEQDALERAAIEIEKL